MQQSSGVGGELKDECFDIRIPGLRCSIFGHRETGVRHRPGSLQFGVLITWRSERPQFAAQGRPARLTRKSSPPVTCPAGRYGSAGGGSGLAWAEGALWVGQGRDRNIHQIDPQTGAILRTIESNRIVTGVTWIDGELWHGTWEGYESDLRRVDPRTGEVLLRLEMPPGANVWGLGSDGGDLYERVVEAALASGQPLGLTIAWINWRQVSAAISKIRPAVGTCEL